MPTTKSSDPMPVSLPPPTTACPQKALCHLTAGPWRQTPTLPAPTTPPARLSTRVTLTIMAGITSVLQPRLSHWTGSLDLVTKVSLVGQLVLGGMWPPWAGSRQDMDSKLVEIPPSMGRGSSRSKITGEDTAASPPPSQNTTSPRPPRRLPQPSPRLKQHSTPLQTRLSVLPPPSPPPPPLSPAPTLRLLRRRPPTTCPRPPTLLLAPPQQLPRPLPQAAPRVTSLTRPLRTPPWASRPPTRDRRPGRAPCWG